MLRSTRPGRKKSSKGSKRRRKSFGTRRCLGCGKPSGFKDYCSGCNEGLDRDIERYDVLKRVGRLKRA